MDKDMHTINDLSDYEKAQIKAIKEWFDRPPSLFSYSRLGAAAGEAAEWSVRRVLPDGTVDRAIEILRSAGSIARRMVPTDAIEGALSANMWLAEKWVDEESTLRELEATRFEDLRAYNIERLDRVAGSIHDWAIGYGGATGGASGAGGIFLAVPGIAAVINISLRTIRKIGLCYGYSTMNDVEQQFLYRVLALGGGAGQADKLAFMTTLREIQVMVGRKTFGYMAERAAQNAMSKEALVTTMREVAKRLGYQLTRKRILMSVPLISGGVGLLLDGNYVRKVGWAATRSFQRRWFLDNGKWPLD
jgi:hypothetical protein